MVKLLRTFSMLVALLCAYPAADAQSNDLGRPKIGLVLSGGGAKGAAHVGVIRVLEEMGVPVDLVVGTSMGAIVGGLYASGLSGEELDRAIREFDWQDVFDDEPPRAERSLRRKRDDADFLVRYKLGIKDGEPVLPQGVILGQKLMLSLRKLSGTRARSDFDDLARPFRAVAADLETGEPVILKSGSLALAMRASMSVPGVFPPVDYDGRLLVDGGIANNLPIDVARALGADVVIAVNVQTDPKSRAELQSVINIVDQTVNLLILRETRRQIKTLNDDDVLVQPALGDIGSGDFLRAADAIHLGKAAALDSREQLQALAALESNLPQKATEQPIESEPLGAPIISSIRIENDTPLADEVLRSRLRVREGEALNVDELERDLSKIYGLGHFDTVDYRLTGEGNESILVITARQKATGLDNLRFGLNLESDFAGESAFNIGLNYDITAVNALGAEWRNEFVFGELLKVSTEFYQPLDYTSQWFVEPQASYEEQNVAVFDDGNQVAEVRVKTLLAGIDVGREFGSCCEARVGLRVGRGEIDRTSGVLEVPADEFGVGSFVASLTHDTLDSIRFPRHGTFAFVAYAESTDALGADSSSRLVNASLSVARSWERNTVFGQLRAGLNLDDGEQVQDLYTLGGFLNLSGFRADELSGEHFVLANLIYYRRMGGSGDELLGVPVYAGGSIEYGGVFEEIGDFTSDESIAAGSLFVGADTPIGPLYLGFGLAEGGNRAAYLFLGQTF